jgi:hypothetical protein
LLGQAEVERNQIDLGPVKLATPREPGRSFVDLERGVFIATDRKASHQEASNAGADTINGCLLICGAGETAS